jgi:hypothetical protein
MTTTTQTTSRSFDLKLATRERVPLLVGLMSPSGGGKTYSALRLASGIQRVTGGDIALIDTEARRGLHYADRFSFRHLEFCAPFGPLDYLAAIEHCVSHGAKTIIVDSFTHEHTGEGGVLEMHNQELDRLSKGDPSKRESMNFPAWAKPKADRTRLLSRMLQIDCNFILSFRAKEKIRLVPRAKRKQGEEPIQALGLMPIGGEEYIFEMTVNCLLPANSGGVPVWRSDEVGERMMIKLPEQFKSIFADEQPLSEDIGEALARWAAGETKDPASEIRAAIRESRTVEALKALLPRIEKLREDRIVAAPEYKAIRELFKAHGEKLVAAASSAEDYGDKAASA